MTRTLNSTIEEHFASSAAAILRTGEMYVGLMSSVAERIVACLGAGGKLLTCGNGGSASDAEHIAGEFVGRFRRERGPLPAIALTGSTCALTAIGNDYGFEQIFARGVLGHGRPGDVLFALSTSGKSPNVLAAVRAAKNEGIYTVGFTGKNAEGLAELADDVFAVPSGVTAEIQQCHITIAHAICEAVDDLLLRA